MGKKSEFVCVSQLRNCWNDMRRRPLTVAVALQEIRLEPLNSTYHILHHGLRWQNCSSEVIRSWILAEARTGKCRKTRRLKQTKAPLRIRFFPSRLRNVHEHMWQLKLREGVEGTVYRQAVDALNRIQSGYHNVGTMGVAPVERLALAIVKLPAGVTNFRRAHDQIHEPLTRNVGAHLQRRKFQEGIKQVLREVAHLKVPSSSATFTKEALRRTMKADELQFIRVRLSQRENPLSEAVESLLFVPNVLLIHFIRKQHQSMMVAEHNHLINICWFQQRACWISRVDHAQGTGGDAHTHRLCVHFLQVVHIHTPALGLIKVVRNESSAEQLNRGRVQGVLRHAAHNAVSGPVDEQPKGEHDGTARAIRQKDL
mmetsp:Transcript_28069/g.32508  ORF Transcript_28069/g.32508 Transcript_28069/m.32508 type:complete len:370 (+) Transcript_28069:214-1323(+)